MPSRSLERGWALMRPNAGESFGVIMKKVSPYKQSATIGKCAACLFQSGSCFLEQQAISRLNLTT